MNHWLKVMNAKSRMKLKIVSILKESNITNLDVDLIKDCLNSRPFGDNLLLLAKELISTGELTLNDLK